MATHKRSSKTASRTRVKERQDPISTEPGEHVQKENIQPHGEGGGDVPRPPLNALANGTANTTSHDEPSSVLVAVLQRLERMEAQLQKEQSEKRDLEATIKTFRQHTNSETAEVPEANTAEPTDWHQKYLELQEHVSDSHPAEDVEEIVPKPAGTCGKDWSLQVAMGLVGSSKKNAKYAALLRAMRDLVLNAGLKWELGWKEISASDKSKLFQVARERHPVLKRYANDWATAEMAKQYIKNKRAHYYNNGWLEVPEKYAYLKQNSAKRNPTGSRVKRAKVEMAAKRKGKRALVHHKRDDGSVDDGESEEPDDQDEGGDGEEGTTM